jgi:uncharacterized membrane protein YfcA
MDLAKRKTLTKNIYLCVCGAFIGFANGFFGGGGGMLLVPALTFIAKLEQKESHATAIAVILPLSVVTAVIYTLSGRIEIAGGLVVGAGVMAGGIAGALLLKKLPKKVLSAVFYIAMIAAGIRMVIG